MLVVLYFLIAGFLWPIFIGILFASFQDGYSSDFNRKEARADLGASVNIAFLAALIWPCGWILMLTLTGFCKNGIYFRPK
jgi:hypothetical protein